MTTLVASRRGPTGAEEAMVEGRDGRTKEGRGGRAARTGREQTAPAGHLETFAKNASYMGGLREGWIEKHSNKEEATGGTGRGCSDVTHTHTHTHTHRSPTRTGPCTLNAVGLLSLDVETRGLPPLAPPPRVCGEVYLTLPYLTPRASRKINN